jgi:hypothetical protein
VVEDDCQNPVWSMNKTNSHSSCNLIGLAV